MKNDAIDRLIQKYELCKTAEEKAACIEEAKRSFSETAAAHRRGTVDIRETMSFRMVGKTGAGK